MARSYVRLKPYVRRKAARERTPSGIAAVEEKLRTYLSFVRANHGMQPSQKKDDEKDLYWTYRRGGARSLAKRKLPSVAAERLRCEIEKATAASPKFIPDGTRQCPHCLASFSEERNLKRHLGTRRCLLNQARRRRVHALPRRVPNLRRNVRKHIGVFVKFLKAMAFGGFNVTVSNDNA